MNLRVMKITNRSPLYAGAVGPAFFVVVFLIEGATRPGYSAWRNFVSQLATHRPRYLRVLRRQQRVLGPRYDTGAARRADRFGPAHFNHQRLDLDRHGRASAHPYPRQLEVLAADTAPKLADNLLILIEDSIGVGFPLQAVTTVDRCAKRLQ